MVRKERADKILHALVFKPVLRARLDERRRRWGVPVGWIDVPLPDSTVRGFVDVQGWALGRGGRAIREVDVRVDGAIQGTAPWGYFRPDVGETHPGDEHSFSGFSYTLDTARLSNGPHTLDVTATDDVSRRVVFGGRSIIVQN